MQKPIISCDYLTGKNIGYYGFGRFCGSLFYSYIYRKFRNVVFYLDDKSL